MKWNVIIAVIALLAGAQMLSSKEGLARDFGDAVNAKDAANSVSMNRTMGWIRLHRPDGEVVHINVDQIVFVSNAKNAGGNERAMARLQLVNGFSDVLETVDEVMQYIKIHEMPGVAASTF